MNKLILILLTVIVISSGCDDVISPALENNLTLEKVYKNASYAQGLLLDAYCRIVDNSYSFSDVATDNAVSNLTTNAYRKLATGQWTSSNTTLSQWQNSYSAIQYLNLFLSVSDSVAWASDKNVKIMFNNRMKGEAYGLRALFMYYLLQRHAGYSSDGTLLGVPILLKYVDSNSDFNIARSTFSDCMKQLYQDLDSAVNILPTDFEDITSAASEPAKYVNLGVSYTDYNRVFGTSFRLRLSGRIVKAIRARAALLAASPAFNNSNDLAKWTAAADYSAQVIDLNNGVSGLSSTGLNWYNQTTEITNLGSGVNQSEVLWRTDISTNNTIESDNYPPSLYGSGRINPSQNLVDAFPMANGYPITDASSGYNSAAPYTNRDPRLALYIVTNGSTIGATSGTVYTSVDGGTKDGLNSVETSTRTGYYMRKLLRGDVNLTPSSSTTQKHIVPRMRYTEVYLNYAEAANEAWGPTGTGTHTYSAYDVIKAIRKRALGLSTDPYLESIKTDQPKMRALIRNERRLELCFEDFRFWDLRRWSSTLTEAANGMKIQNGTYSIINNVEERKYDSFMNYGPIPYTELLKCSALVQNKGW